MTKPSVYSASLRGVVCVNAGRVSFSFSVEGGEAVLMRCVMRGNSWGVWQTLRTKRERAAVLRAIAKAVAGVNLSPKQRRAKPVSYDE